MVRVPRSVATASLILLFVACSSKGEPRSTSTASPRPGQTTASPGRTFAPSPGRTASTPKTGGTGTPSPFDDDGPLGSMARAFLGGSSARLVVVEVDWVSGRTPSDAALGHLQSLLRSVSDADVSVRRGTEFPSSREAYSVADIQAIERARRSAHSTSGTAAMWIVYLNGSFAEGEGALGVAYSASAAAIFRDRIDDATTALIASGQIERSVVAHEAGHLLALVNIGYRSAYDHEDKEHPGHSNNQDSVMYWAIEDISLRNLLGGGAPPSDFDEADRADLRVLRG